MVTNQLKSASFLVFVFYCSYFLGAGYAFSDRYDFQSRFVLIIETWLTGDLLWYISLYVSLLRIISFSFEDVNESLTKTCIHLEFEIICKDSGNLVFNSQKIYLVSNLVSCLVLWAVPLKVFLKKLCLSNVYSPIPT